MAACCYDKSMAKILLDIDGVILPTRDRDPWGRFPVADWDGEKRMIDEEMRSRVVRLFQLGSVVWCSNWQGRSAELGKALFVPETDFLPIEIRSNRWAEELNLHRSQWSWKLHSIMTHFADETSPLIWIDDNIEEDAFLWQKERPGKTLLVKTEESIGLTDEHLEEVTRFLTGSS